MPIFFMVILSIGIFARILGIQMFYELRTNFNRFTLLGVNNQVA